MTRRRSTYRGLRALVDGAVVSLNRLGVGRGDRVAIVLPNGPEMATAFLSVAAAAASAPLNPAYRQDEFEFYLSDLKAKALIVEAGSASPAIRCGGKARRRADHADAGAASRGRGVPAFGRVNGRRGAGAAPPSLMTSRSSCTRRAPPRGRKSCR